MNKLIKFAQIKLSQETLMDLDFVRGICGYATIEEAIIYLLRVERKYYLSKDQYRSLK